MPFLRSPFRSLRSRLLLAALLVEIVVLSLLIANSLRLIDHHVEHQTQLRIAAIETAYRTAVAVPLASHDYATLRDILEGWLRTEDMRYLAVTDTAGRTIAQAGTLPGGGLPDPSHQITAGEPLHVRFTVDYLGQVFGQVHYGLDTSALQLARSELLTQSGLLAAGELLLSTLLLSLMAFWLTRHLVALAAATGEVAAGRYDIRMPEQSEDEVGQLARHFNAMAGAVQHRISALEYQAHHDSLTGLYNRNAFESELTRLLADTHTLAQAVLLIDLDQFKVINDTCGHAAGDQLLRELAGVLQQACPPAYLARMGGDEFGLLLSVEDATAALAIAAEVISALHAHPFLWEGHKFPVSASLGVVVSPPHPPQAQGMLAAADTACYAAKEHGRNRTALYDADSRYFRGREQELRSVADIAAALDEGRFELFFQRVVALQRCDGDKAEILVRMYARDGQLIQPADFIPAAERFNLMPTLDRWIIDETLRRLADWQQAGHPPAFAQVAVNLSGSSLSDPALLAFIREAFARHGVPPGRICFEITESCAVAHPELGQSFINGIRQLGAGLALDDFGSGLSSFAYLKRFAVDILKIDGLFIRHLDQDASDRAVVEAMVQLARAHGLKTVAEFVISPDVAKVVCALGIDYAQGYALHRPVPFRADEVYPTTTG